MSKFIKRERLYLGEGIRFGIGRGRFFVTHIADGQCQIEYNLKAGSDPEGGFVLPVPIAEELLQVEVVEKMLRQERDKARYWKDRAKEVQYQDKEQLQESLERLKRRVIQLEAGEAESYELLNRAKEDIKSANKLLQTAMAELQESEAAAFKSEAAASQWRMIALVMLIGNLVLFGSFTIYLKFFL
jgi:hypothetical protein